MDDAGVRKSALAVATLTSFITPFMGSSAMIALPSIGKDFQMDAILLSWVATSYLLSAAVFLVPFGRLADLYGRKKIFTLGMIIFTISTLFVGLSISAPMLIIGRVVQGAGSAMIFANGIAILTSVYPPQERGKVLGINVAAVYIGLSVGPFFGGMLTQYLTWRSIFLVTVPLGLSVILLILWKLKGEWADAAGEKFDLTGSIIYGLAIIALMYGVTLLPAMSSIWIIVSGIVGLAAFVVWEMKIESPVFEIRLFSSNRTFAFSSLAALVNYSATTATMFLLSLYLQHIKALSPQNAGLVLIAQPIVMATLSPFAGRLSDRIEPRVVASIGMSLTTAGLVLLTRIDQDTPLWYLIICLITLGFGFAFFSSPNTNAILSSVEKRYYGIASGTVGTMRLLGQMFSMGISTLIFALLIGRVQITPELYPAFIKSVQVAFSVFSVLCFMGIFASIVRGNIRQTGMSAPPSGK